MRLMYGFWRNLGEYTGLPHYLAAASFIIAIVVAFGISRLSGWTFDEGLTIAILLVLLDALSFRLYRWHLGRVSACAIRDGKRNGPALHLARSLQRTSLLRAGAKIIWAAFITMLFLRLEVIRVGGVPDTPLGPGNLNEIGILGLSWLDEIVVDWTGQALRWGLFWSAFLFLLADLVEDIDYRLLFGIVPQDGGVRGIYGPSLAIVRLEDQLREALAENERLRRDHRRRSTGD